MAKISATRDEIKKELEATTMKLRVIRADLRLARAQASSKGRYMAVSQYQNMMAQEDALVSKLVNLQGQLANMPKPALSFAQMFMVAAEEYLDSVDFENIKAKAHQMCEQRGV